MGTEIYYWSFRRQTRWLVSAFLTERTHRLKSSRQILSRENGGRKCRDSYAKKWLSHWREREPEAHQASWELEARVTVRPSCSCKLERGASDAERSDP